jgi:hypothetical protein
MLDIVDYKGPDVEVLGLPVEKVHYDHRRHVVVHRDWDTSVDWSALQIPSTSFWRICLLRLQDFDVQYGIFDLPGKEHRRYERTMNEWQQLKDIGVL